MTYTTQDACQLLGVTRQRVHRLAERLNIAPTIRGGVAFWEAWQLDALTRGRQRAGRPKQKTS